MLASIRSFLRGREDTPSPSPPPVTVTGVRIPADGTPAHFLPLTTTSDCGETTFGFLFHAPDLRRYWSTERAWEFRDIQRLDLLQDDHIPRSHHLRQKRDLRRLLYSFGQPNRQELLHLRQRYLLQQQYHVLRQQHSSCIGGYYVFYSFAVDDLSENPSVPAWISDMGEGFNLKYYGDVFLVKLAPHESGEHDWAAYEDIDPQFLDLLVEGPLEASEQRH